MCSWCVSAPKGWFGVFGLVSGSHFVCIPRASEKSSRPATLMVQSWTPVGHDWGTNQETTCMGAFCRAHDFEPKTSANFVPIEPSWHPLSWSVKAPRRAPPSGVRPPQIRTPFLFQSPMSGYGAKKWGLQALWGPKKGPIGAKYGKQIGGCLRYFC